MYTNLVVIVNEKKTVDKSNIINRFNGLRSVKVGVKALYPTGMVVG